MFALYVFQAAKFLIWDLPQEKKREAAKLAEEESLDDAIVQIADDKTIEEIHDDQSTHNSNGNVNKSLIASEQSDLPLS